MRPSRSAKRYLSSSPTQCACQYLHHRPRRPPVAHEHPGLPFSTSIQCLSRRKPTHKSIPIETYQKMVKESSKAYKPYTDAEKKILAQKYSPEQMAALEAGEAAISAEDLTTQARIRGDAFAFEYLDDFSRIDPVVDKRISRLRGEGDDYIKAFAEGNVADVEDPDEKIVKIGDALLQPDPDQPLDAFDSMWTKIMRDGSGSVTANKEVVRTLLDSPGGTRMEPDEAERFLNEAASLQPLHGADGALPDASASQAADPTMPVQPLITASDGTTISAAAVEQIERLIGYDKHPSPPSVAPTLPMINDPRVSWVGGDAESGFPEDKDLDEETRGLYALLSKQTGHSITALRRFRVKNLVAHRVVNQTRLGKIQSMYFLTIAGNQNGLLGVGEGKAAEAEDARRAAMLAAIRNMKPIPRYENRTIFGTVKGKVGAVRLSLSSRPPGFGIRTQHLIFEMARAAGISDLAGKVGKARNKMNVCKATWAALLSQQDPEDLARARGKKFVDVRKVYYAGEV